MFELFKNNKEFSIYRIQIKSWRICLTNLTVNRRVIWRFAFLLVCHYLWFAFIIYACCNIGFNNSASQKYSMKRRLLLFHSLLNPLPSGLRMFEQGWNKDLQRMRISGFNFSSFSSFCSILRLSIHAYSKT